jgi:hypothetical protein
VPNDHSNANKKEAKTSTFTNLQTAKNPIIAITQTQNNRGPVNSDADISDAYVQIIAVASSKLGKMNFARSDFIFFSSHPP